MCCEVEVSKCDICGEVTSVSRKYYDYPIACECCNGNHSEIVRYCKACKDNVRPPHRISAVVKPI